MTPGGVAALFAVWAVAVVSPGPDLAVVLQRGLAGRRQGLATALGVVTGIAVWLTAAVAGLAAVVRVHPALMTGLQIGGGLLLVWVGAQGLRARRAAPTPADRAGPRPRRRPPHPAPTDPVCTGPVRTGPLRTDVVRGLATNLANPKALVFFGAVLTPFLTDGPGPAGAVLLVAAMVAVALAWFCAVALLASHPRLTTRMGRWTPVVEVVLSAVLVALGVGFVAAAVW